MLAAVALLATPQGVHLGHFPWWEASFKVLRNEGLLYGYDGHYVGRHRIAPEGYRYFCAVRTNSAAITAFDVAKYWHQSQIAYAQGKADYELSTERASFIKASRPLPSLVREFSKELTELGVDVPALKSELERSVRIVRDSRVPRKGEALTRFPDVPSKHWADEAVHNLRRAGILWGYPDGKFGS